MNVSLAITALMMGLVGGPHCIAMCGAACAGIGQMQVNSPNRIAIARGQTRGIALFQLGRVAGYASLGLLAGASVQLLGWLSIQSSALRPAWTMLHLAAIGVGIMLLIQARQPVWLDTGARRLWSKFKAHRFSQHAVTPLLMGGLWALMPCGLLYSALMVAALTGSAYEGAALMALFALGTSVSLTLTPLFWLKLKAFTGAGQWGVRLAGLALAASSGWGLWLGLVHNTAPWCVTPAV